MMLFYIIFLILNEINGYIILRDNKDYSIDRPELPLSLNKNKSHEISGTNLPYVIGRDLIFIFALIMLFAVLVFCLCYRSFLFNLLINFWSKLKLNHDNINEHIIKYDRTASSIT
jgi:hypothetical protein